MIEDVKMQERGEWHVQVQYGVVHWKTRYRGLSSKVLGTSNLLVMLLNMEYTGQGADRDWQWDWHRIQLGWPRTNDSE